MKITLKINSSFGKKGSSFFLHAVLVFLTIIFNSYAIKATDLEKDPNNKSKLEISATEGSLIYEENVIITTTENIYIAPGTIIYGMENINCGIDEVNSAIARNKKKSSDENNALGISKDFVPQKKSIDLVLKKNQDRSNEKVKNILFWSLQNAKIPTLVKPNSNTGLISSSSSSKFSFDKSQNTKDLEVSLFLPKIKREALHCYFVYFENKKLVNHYLEALHLFNFLLKRIKTSKILDSAITLPIAIIGVRLTI